ncbi:MAG: M28 family peptidase, partial [Chloroflexi bacterium]|nr:M28 family peptidase [Chloroflexota bacterium]
LSLFSATELMRTTRSQRQWLSFWHPTRPSADVLVRVPAREQMKQRVVLIGHTDTNKARMTFSKPVIRWLTMLLSAGTLVPLINGLALLSRALNGRKKARLTQRLTVLSLLSFIPLLLLDERGPYIDGANDNASAVACLLGLGAYLKQQPLKNTEVWLAFTGAEEVGSLGLHHLLDVYGEQLRDAWFIDFEMVGARDIVYILDHGVSYLTPYGADRASLELAFETSRQYPELRVNGQAMTIVEEVGALRGRGFRGLCLAGIDREGWLVNWHQRSDTVANIEPIGLEKAARFALGMMEIVDERG